VSRWVNEAVLERAEARWRQRPDVMQLRRATVEHPFGTSKAWMGLSPFGSTPMLPMASQT